ncbi:Leucocyanidin oxygenase [Bertholletia excelsa]
MEVAGNQIRVQSLAQSGATKVQPEYIQPPNCRPSVLPCPITGTSDKGIPLVDISGSTSEVHRVLGQACQEWGAFQVINHGVPIQLLDDMRRIGITFFEDCPVTEKLKYCCEPNSFASEGYGSRMLVSSNDTVLDWRDYFDHHTLPLSRRNPSRWPNFPPNYRDVVLEYSDHMKALSQRLLKLISESLCLPSSLIEEAVEDFYQNITVSYYPPCPQPELTLGLQAHSDIGAITLLIQDDVSGLQVLKDGEWVNINPLSEAIVVILADQTEIITNGKCKSAVHRAITNSNKARLSVATFHDPAKTRTISPASELISDSSPPRYRQVMYGDYVSSWYTKGPEGRRNIDGLLL